MGLFSRKKKATSYQTFSSAARRHGPKGPWKHAASVAKRNARRGRGLFKK